MNQALINGSTLTGPTVRTTVERIDTIVAEWVRTRPDAPAVAALDGVTTYGDLDAEAGRIAAALHTAGVRRGDVVSVRVAPSASLVACLLGVLRLGAVYTPITLDWPVARVAHILARTGAVVSVVDSSDPVTVPGTPSLDVAELSAGRAPVDVVHRTDGKGISDEAFCVFFTSGSTGTPKAAAAPHAGVIRLARDPRLRFGPTSTMLQTAPVGWDAFAMELWCPLLSGGTTVVSGTRHLMADDLRLAVGHGVNTLFLTTSLFNATADEAPEVFADLDILMVGGERVSPERLVRIRRDYPSVRVFNVYGPVECSIYATAQEIHETTSAEVDVPIGTPIADTGLHVLDEHGALVPAGTVGEIALSGPGLALNYLGDLDGTAERFPTLPLGEGGAPLRVYLTGDLGSVNAEGTVDFFGRKDRQVKIRGVRVDANEVERLISDLPGVGEAAVLPLPRVALNKDRLAAFYAVEEGGAITAAEISAAVAAALPDAFVPDVVLLLPELPRLTNTKVDPAALEELADRRPGAEPAEPVAEGESSVLRTVVESASELLACPVPVDTDLFTIGANSITAIRLANRLTRTLGTKVPVSVVLTGRTPAAIVAAIEAGPSTQD